jgi:glutamate N-acetyltransferase / amino-acid N-acetyltransferase
VTLAGFSSRWVEQPAHVTELDPVALPEGFRAAGVAAGIKPDGLDVALLQSTGPAAASAARFTTSALRGAPVIVSQDARLDALRAVLVSSGNANVADGARGLETARAAQGEAARALGLRPEEVGIAATGVIGRELPRARLLAGVAEAASALGADAEAFCDAIMTTDRGPKRACLEVSLAGGRVRLAGQAKGAGMMAPAFSATLICVVESDVRVDAGTLDRLLDGATRRSFDRITVDGQLSTSDTLFLLAGGASGLSVEPGSEDERRLGAALIALMRTLALEVVRDGEGAHRVGRIVVRGPDRLVEPVARAVADSPLVKTALHGADPNFGRILQAAGQAMAAAGERIDASFPVDLRIEGRPLVRAGVVTDLDPDVLADLEQAVSGVEVDYELDIPGGAAEAELFFSDLGHGYVSLNAEYTT